MDLVLRYLESALRLRNLAATEKDPQLRADLEKQAQAYRRLAEQRTKDRGPPLPDKNGL
jgi:hypothetical protein